MSITHVICFSGGHASALCAVETVRKYGAENCILLNHDISSKVEDSSVKEFKLQVADALGVKLSFANAKNFEGRTPLQVAREKGNFACKPGQHFCTYELKTKPFHEWLKKNFPVKKGRRREDVRVVYGFDANEPERIERRRTIMNDMGYDTEFPLASNDCCIRDIREIGIEPPSVYKSFLHANCVGCLKAGVRSWYVTYCLRPDVFEEAVETENVLKRSILKKCFLIELIPQFEMMKKMGIEPTDRGDFHRFWKETRRRVPNQLSLFPCMFCDK